MLPADEMTTGSSSVGPFPLGAAPRSSPGEQPLGLFCANLHFRTEDDRALSAALDRRGVARYRILPARNGWTSLYEERASGQDDDWIRDLGGGLSRDLQVAAIAFLVHDSDIA